MKKNFVAKRIACAAAVLLCCSVLFIHTNARAQCGSCSDIIINPGRTTLTCGCTTEICSGHMCTNTSEWTFSLSASATCCIDSILVTPPSGVCWEGCMGVPNGMSGPIYWSLGYGNHGVCSSGPGSFAGALACCGNPTTYICACGQSASLQICSTSTDWSGFTVTFYWTDGTSCTASLY